MSFSRISNRSPQLAASARHDTVDYIEFVTGEGKIRINKKNVKVYNNQTRYDVAAADNPDFWNMVIVHHNGRQKKEQILKKLFEIADDVECYIVGYREFAREDFFFIRLCRQFLAKLFSLSLKFKMPDFYLIYLSVKLNVAEYKSDQIHHIATFERAFTERCNHYEMFEGVSKVLNLNNFAKSPEFAEIAFTLGNKSSLALLCSTITKHCDIFKVVNGILLSNNDLVELSPFAAIPAIDVQVIDLRNNKIRDVGQFKYLRKMNATELLIDDNPVSLTANFMNRILEILPNLVKIDGEYTRTTTPSLINLGAGENMIEVIFQGDTIKSDESLPPHLFRKYKTSDMWHQVIINHNGKYAKSELLFAIFSSLNTHELYPCYYKVGQKNDTFFVRNCY
ncbi:Nuclear RNA export factor 2, partial [Pseudolycoriella hygida]